MNRPPRPRDQGSELNELRTCLDTAVAAARAAETIIQQYYRGDFETRYKADASPVTAADIECERVIRAVLSRAFPTHGFYGEELGRDGADADADYVWLIDPIDGTKSFVRGTPFFSTQIALAYRGELLVGVSNAPMFGAGELACAARGLGASLNDEPLRTSDVANIGQASLSLGNIASLAASKAWNGVGQLIGAVDRIRGYGDFYHYHLLAGGGVDAVIESDVNILDIAALTVIVREAGGEITELGGSAINIDSRSVLATNGRLRDAIRAYLMDWDEDVHAPG